MARADNWIEDFENNHFYHETSDRHYEVTLHDGEMYQRRYQLDDRGKRYNELELKVDAIIGSGLHVRTYLYRTIREELFQMPLAWYTASGSWGMNPGYDLAQHGHQINADEATLMLVAAIAQHQLGNSTLALQALSAARLAAQKNPVSLFIRNILFQEAARVFGR